MRWGLTNAALARETGSWRVEGQIVDLTDRKSFEEPLRARQTLHSVIALARATAHEILNPLTPLVRRLELLARRLHDPANPETDRDIDVALRSAEAIRDIVRHLLNITQLEFEEPSKNTAEMLDIRRSAPAALPDRPI
jgi:signal transduction histidine kinase